MILVTGGTGLLGSYLLHELAVSGNKVKALIRPGRGEQFKELLFKCFNCDTRPILDNIIWEDGDVLDKDSLNRALKDVDEVYHCAGMISFNPKERSLMHRINVEGTANVVETSLAKKVRKMVHVSSISALGRCEGLIDEGIKWLPSERHSAYGISKYYGEQEVWKGIAKGLNAVIVNPSVIIGAGSHEKAMTPFFKGLEKMLPFYTRGVTGYVDVRDVVKAMTLLMKSDISGEQFVLNADNVPQRVLFRHCSDLLGKRGPRFYLARPVLTIAWVVESFRAKLSGSAPGLTLENVRSVTGINRYTAQKFSKRFDYEFIPVKESLEYSLKTLGLISQGS
ncbi:MAG TPA: NAD-dependent epimerase/dehydratase family protein [Lentimicrobium sp.]|nr:NAD-dependent epimerase/dehydratase family protein [Lentimicrobium sp.]